jgi:WD40 repeat protein
MRSRSKRIAFGTGAAHATRCLFLLVLLLIAAGRMARAEDQASFARLITGVAGFQAFSQLHLTPDARWAIVASASAISIIDVRTGLVVQDLRQRDGSIRESALSPDGRFVLAAGTSGVSRWEISSHPSSAVKLVDGDYFDVTFSPNGKYAAAGTQDGQIVVWDTSTWSAYRRVSFRPPLSTIAFSPDGRYLSAAQGFKNDTGYIETNYGGQAHVAVWDLLSGLQLWENVVHPYDIQRIQFTADGAGIVSAAASKSTPGKAAIALSDARTGQLLSDFGHYALHVTDMAPRSQGELIGVAQESYDRRFLIALDTHNGAVRTLCSRLPDIDRLALSRSAGVAVGAPAWGSHIFLWRDFPTCGGATKVGLNPDMRDAQWGSWSQGGIFIRKNGPLVMGWDSTLGQRAFTVHLPDDYPWFVGDGPTRDLFGIVGDKTLWIRHLRTGAAAGSIDLSTVGRRVDSYTFIDSRTLALAVQNELTANPAVWATGNGEIYLFDIATQRVTARFRPHQEAVGQMVFDSKTRTLISAGFDGTIAQTDVDAKPPTFKIVRVGGQAHGLALAPKGDRFAAAWVSGSAQGCVGVWKISSTLPEWIGGDGIAAYSVQYSADGTSILAAGNRVLELNAVDGSQRREYLPDGDVEFSTVATYANDGRLVLAMTNAGIGSLWRVDGNNRPIARVLFSGEHALVQAGDRFDTDQIEALGPVGWVLADDKLEALPLEMFMRDYFEPRLLSHILGREARPLLPRLSDLNLAQPKVRILSVAPGANDPSGSAGDTARVTVTVEVEGGERAFTTSGKERQMRSGVYDLRLFRDGQLVDQRPAEAQGSEGATQYSQSLAQWREQRQMSRFEDGATRVVFKDIRVPRLPGKNSIEFSAYAFNESRIKSETTRFSYNLPTDVKPRVPHAYVVTIGVNTFDDPAWNLKYAANDARQAGSELRKRLEALMAPGGEKQYEQVVWVPLVSERAQGTGSPQQPTEAAASKRHVEAVLKALAGQKVDARDLADVPAAVKLRRAEPEDLVIIVVSTHGLVDKRGTFYFLPSDIGSRFDPVNEPEGASRAAMLAKTVSNDELSQWLRGLDAADQVLIIDACHSSASVQNEEFKPGPMGSNGLGQLAYDKGMRVLAATQVDQDAVDGTGRTKMGLLIYALIEDGLRKGKADYSPADGTIMLSEWLSYGSQRVPELIREVRDRTLKGSRGTVQYSTDAMLNAARRTSLEQPTMFDFARGRDRPLSSNNGRAGNLK